jgi:uncharacterized protein involved in outer membrane biogenesis
MRWKWILGILAGLILAFVITIYIIISSYDFSRLKPLITAEIKNATGRELTIGGNIEVKIGYESEYA